MHLLRVIQRAKGRPPGGYALPEVLIAAVVLAIIAMAFYFGLSSGFLITQAAREDLRATQILTQKIEGIRLCTWNQLVNYTFREPYDPLGSTNGQGVGVIYHGTVSLSPPGDVPSGVTYWDKMRTVSVNLRWTNWNGRIPIPQSRTMQTQVARYGLQSYVWGGFRQNALLMSATRVWDVQP